MADDEVEFALCGAETLVEEMRHRVLHPAHEGHLARDHPAHARARIVEEDDQVGVELVEGPEVCECGQSAVVVGLHEHAGLMARAGEGCSEVTGDCPHSHTSGPSTSS